MKKKRQWKDKGGSICEGWGFSLLEVLVAVAIVGGVVVVLMQSLSWHLDLLGNHKKATEAVFIAEDILRVVTPKNMDSPPIKVRLEEARKDGFDIKIHTEEGPVEGIKVIILEIHYGRDVYTLRKVVPSFR